MGKAILGIVLGYVAMALFIFVTFSIVYLLIGTEGAFHDGSYDVTLLWIVVSLVLGLIAAIIGGVVCAKLTRHPAGTKILAGLVLVLGLVMAIPALYTPDEPAPTVRTGEVTVMEAMQVAQQPVWITFANPVIGAIGVMLGAMAFAKRKK